LNIIDKTHFVKTLASDAEMSLAKAEHALNTALTMIAGHLVAGDEVRFKGFGTFSVTHHGARTGRNLQTGTAMDIPARRAPKFKPASSLKASVREGKTP
jgi:DNA-binding protein HU-beta